MKDFPDTPPFAEAPAVFERGHLWLYEHVLGLPFRFRLTDHGTLHIGDDKRPYDPADAPLGHAHALGHVRAHFDRESLGAAIEDPTEVVFFGRATVNRGIEYDWGRLPSFLGVDIWHGGRERFLDPGAVDRIYRELGLDSLTTVEREVNVRDFDPESISFPDSAWYDGPVAGLFVRNKRGGRAFRVNDAVERRSESRAESGDEASLPDDPGGVAAALVTDERYARVASELEALGRPVTFDAVHERLFETVVREAYSRLFERGRAVEAEALRSALADIVGERLGASD